MNITQKDIRAIWRSPVIWVILAVISFMMAWLYWQMIDRYNSLQAGFMALPNPPTITQTLWVPFLLMMAKFMMLVVAFTAGYAIAQEQAKGTLWYVMINRQNFMALVLAKFKAQLIILLYVVLQAILVAWLLAIGGTVNWGQMMIGALGLGLFLCWLIALGQLISSYCQSTGTAVLLNVVSFILLWLLGGDIISQDYGVNWLVVMSPAHHLRWFCDGQVGLSSVLYFVGGTWLFMWMTAIKLKSLRQLS